MHIYPSDDGSIASADGFPFFSLASFAILGAGKTKVLTDRVLRLLLDGAPRPASAARKDATAAT